MTCAPRSGGRPQPAETPVAPPAGAEATGLRLEITATEDDLFVLNQSLSKLRDLLAGGSMQLKPSIDARVADVPPSDRIHARNTVIEPLQERGRVDVRPEWLGPES